MKNYVPNPEAKKTIQAITDAAINVELTPYDFERKEKFVYDYGINGIKKLETEVPDGVRKLLSEFVAIEEEAIVQIQKVPSNDADEIEQIYCNVLYKVNQLLEKAYRSPYSLL